MILTDLATEIELNLSETDNDRKIYTKHTKVGNCLYSQEYL